MSSGVYALLDPVSADEPCGKDLEDTPLLASFDAYRLFGQSTPLPPETEWREIRDKALEALEDSRDFRLLAHYGAAVLRTDGLPEFFATLQVAAKWLAEHWDHVWPRIDEDAILRKNALSGLADRMAVVDAVRRVPVIVNRQLGAFSLRDIDIATGQLAPGEGDTQPPTEAQIAAALEATPFEELQKLEQDVGAAAGALNQVAEAMRSHGGSESVPDFDPLLSQLTRLAKYLQTHIAARSPAGAVADAGAANGAQGSAGAGQVVAVGAIRSRQDAVRALDAVAAFFRQNEPSSPVPMILERAKKLVSKSFLEALEDLAPDGVAQARLIAGIRDES